MSVTGISTPATAKRGVKLMSERMTSVHAPGNNSAYASWGRLTRAEAISEWRRYYEGLRDEAAKALATPDEDLIVETYLGPYAMKNREEVTE